MAQVIFTPCRDFDTVEGTEEKIRLLNDRIDSLERDLAHILSNLDQDNMKSGDASGL